MGRQPNIDWEHVEWLRSYNKTWDSIARDLGVSTDLLVDAYYKRQSRARATS